MHFTNKLFKLLLTAVVNEETVLVFKLPVAILYCRVGLD